MPPGHPDVGGARGAGPADLAADAPGIGGEQRVLVEQGLGLVPGHHETLADRLVVLHERGHPERLPGDQGQVIGRSVLARRVQAVRVDGHGVVGLQVPGLGVDQRHALAERPRRLRQGDRGVVRGDRQQRGEQVGDLVRAPGHQAGHVRHGRGSLLAGHRRGVGVEHRDQGDRGQHLERAGRAVPPVRVLGREHLAGVGVGHHERRGLDAGQPGRRARRVAHDHPAASQRGSADGLRRRPRRPARIGRPRRKNHRDRTSQRRPQVNPFQHEPPSSVLGLSGRPEVTWAYGTSVGVRTAHRCRLRRQQAYGLRPAEKLGQPGEYPFTRGVYPRMYVDRPWTMRQYAGFATAKESNRRYHELIEAGTTGLSVAFDLPTQMGYDSDSPVAHGEVGKVGVAIDCTDDMRTLFDEIPLKDVSTSMTINAPAAVLLLMYQTVGEEQGAQPEPADRHDPERRAQGVHRAGHLHLPAAPVAAPGGRHVRLLPRGTAQVEHHLHLRLPHGRGGRHPGAGKSTDSVFIPSNLRRSSYPNHLHLCSN